MGKPPRPRPIASASPKKSGSNINNAVPAGAAKFSSNSSTGSGSTANAPSSVMCVPASPLTRDLSDLSGSYMNGNTNPRRMLHHSNSNFSTANTDDGSSYHPPGFWHQAHILSSPCPAVREPQHASSSPSRPKAPAEAPALIVVERNGVIELVKKSLADDDNDETAKNNKTGEGDEHGIVRQSSEPRGSDLLGSMEDNIMFLAHATTSPSSNSMDQQQHQQQQQHDSLLADENSARIPILILLLDPGRKQYEIMQLWVDLQTDLVRDVLYTLQRKLSDKWRQDYDGLFQLRGSNYCQLLHILDIAKYDVRPREILVAKPWSMAAKAASEHATDCIKQLRAGGLLSVYSDTPSSSKSLIKNFLRNKSSANSGRISPTFQEEKPLTLSEDAVKRLYFPDGTFLNHHHAHQFLSFRAPSPLPQVVGTRTQQQNRFFGSLLGTSTSFDDDSSQLSNPLFGADPQSDKYISQSSTIGSAPSPSRRRRQQYQRGYAPRLSSHFDPTLPAVGEGTTTNARETEGKNNTHYILADLEGNTEENDLNEPLVGAPDKKKKRSRLKKMLAPLNCASCHRSSASKIRNDGYSSGGSSSVKNSNNQHCNNNRNTSDGSQNGRDTPTSNGSDDAWEGAKCQEDGSIISESAPLLASMLASSSCSILQHPLVGQQLVPQPGPKQQVLARPAPFSRMGKF